MPAITTQLIVEQAERLGEGGHRFTARQLYYASCAAAEAAHPSATRGIIGISAILVLLGAALVRLAPPAALSLGLIGAAGLLFALLNAHSERTQALARAKGPRPLLLSYEGFTAGPLREALAAAPEPLRALAGAEPDGAAGAASPPEAGARGRRPRGALLLACEREETARMLAANLPHLPAGSEVVVLPVGNAAGEDAEAPVPSRGGARGGGPPAAIRRRKVIAIHDADPQGCALPSRLRRAGAAQVIDAGLRPPPADARLAVLEGAPARVPGGLEEDLSPEEIGWLRSGRRLELATLSPGEVLARIAACAPVSPRPPARSRGRGPADGPAQPAVAAPAPSQMPAR